MSLPILNLRSHRTQLALAALASSLVTAGSFAAYNKLSRRRRRRQLQEDIQEALSREDEPSDIADSPEIQTPPDASISSLVQERIEPVKDRILRGEQPEELFREQLARCYALFKEESMERIRNAKVVVVGCGGVGSWAAVMLVRSGISNIRLVDFDRVTMSSLNRHATATLADVGRSKVQAMKSALMRMSLKVEVDTREELWRKEDGSILLEGVDWVIDAIDNITTKVDLLKYCHANGIKVISSMGAGSKLDPTRIQISDISCTAEDPLSRSVRVQLRKAGVSSGIPVVYSTEKPIDDIKLLPLADEEFEKGNIQELTPFDDFRVRILPVFGPLPSIFGLNAAAYVLCEIAGKPIANPLWIKNRHKTYEKLLRELKVREEKITGEQINRLPIDETDVAYIYEDLHRGRSLIPPHRVPNKAALTRWDPSEPVTVQNCVVLDLPELKKYDEGVKERKRPEEIWGEDVQALVERRRKEASEWWEKAMQ
ncbi:ubiquitin-protein ligase molybdopterin-converting factor [Fomitiporia mediterranea MF3/22]|uniref:ubiquitin-protein ligase molybdopterin-converting factor n=1 Tax=Fomitiporia mediterranea (strain MF3/22) TaxID=694068 RepID=UPI000440776D|nr:ubiquitin-protein ligase molybdopterin-converting factor [Fomitiporia mediterranea MF3/22]EJD01943.1 ubiquitin-protein ligase molybdopterin-converting factor [Fomitiporia mediterranea MF3/22]